MSPRTKDSEEFEFDYRPIIALFSVFCMVQGVGWYRDPAARFSASAFYTLQSWATNFGLSINHWGIPMFVGGLIIFVGMIWRWWQLRWVGYAITSLTFLSVAESIRRSGILFPDASQSGLRTYVFVGVLPIVLAIVAQVHANERRQRKKGP